MVTVILPGYSPRNKQWVEETAKNLKIGGEIRPVFWDHWTDPDKHLRPKEKAQDIIDIANGDKINIVAKSVGTLVATYIARGVPDQINKIILCGIPSISDERLKIFKEAFVNFPAERIVVYQNEGDPFKSPKEIEVFVSKINPEIKVTSKPRSDHHYPYYEEFDSYLTS